MRVAVIGCRGQLGSDLVRVLRDAGDYDVVPLSRDQLDITDSRQVVSVLGRCRFDGMVNCAALTNVEGCEERVKEALLVNAHGAFEVARA
jgi:dTDP-4-dehydrorhamnose reductase